MLMSILTKFVIVLTICSNELFAYDKELTIHVDAGKQDCFYHPAKVGDVIDFEYQVIDGGHGDLDISFELAEPIGRIIFADVKKSENIHRYEVKQAGDYRFCFDNSFSSFNRKTIFFELIIENSNEPSDDQTWNDILEGLTPEEFYDVKVQDIMDYVGRIRMHLTKARQLQDMIRSFEARDRNVAEENYFKVNTWSLFQIFAMIGVGALQVFMVRSIFETAGSKMHRFWSKLGL